LLDSTTWSEVSERMATFIVVYNQGEGCDYTIDCGVSTIEFEASSLKAAQKRVEEAYLSDGADGDPDELLSHNSSEGNFESIWLVEVKKSVQVSVENLDAELAQRKLNLENAFREEKEREEFERLSKKFNKK
jgi:hypothetical protein